MLLLKDNSDGRHRRVGQLQLEETHNLIMRNRYILYAHGGIKLQTYTIFRKSDCAFKSS